MLAIIFPKSDNAAFLHPKEVARRFAYSIPRVLIDWHQANERLQSELENLIASKTPEPILAGHRNLFNNTFYFQAEFPEVGYQKAEGWVYLDTAIEIRCVGDSLDMEFLHRTGMALADVLDYQLDIVSE